MLIPVNGCFHDPNVFLYSSSLITLAKLYSLLSKSSSSKIPFPTSSDGKEVKRVILSIPLAIPFKTMENLFLLKIGFVTPIFFDGNFSCKSCAISSTVT